MTSTAMREMRVLSSAEIAMVAGGPDPTGAETEITSMFNANDGIYYQGDNYVIMDDGRTFADLDGNGWYDHLEVTFGDTTLIYNPVTHTWDPFNGHDWHNLDG